MLENSWLIDDVGIVWDVVGCQCASPVFRACWRVRIVEAGYHLKACQILRVYLAKSVPIVYPWLPDKAWHASSGILRPTPPPQKIVDIIHSKGISRAVLRKSRLVEHNSMGICDQIHKDFNILESPLHLRVFWFSTQHFCVGKFHCPHSMFNVLCLIFPI